ncbi:hypothetical protein WN943_005553 [Citrus x changshan-huyou]
MADQLLKRVSKVGPFYGALVDHEPPLRPRPKWWAAALTSIVRAAVLALTKTLWGLNVLYILLPCEM